MSEEIIKGLRNVAFGSALLLLTIVYTILRY